MKAAGRNRKPAAARQIERGIKTLKSAHLTKGAGTRAKAQNAGAGGLDGAMERRPLRASRAGEK
jgi:hypothetical protein